MGRVYPVPPIVQRRRLTGDIESMFTDIVSLPFTAITSDALDLSGAATDVVTSHAVMKSRFIGYTIVYTEASSADAGVIVRIGKIEADGTTDDDYFDSVTSEVSKSIGYSKSYTIQDMTQLDIPVGWSVTVGTAGGKTGTGEVKIVLKIVS